MKTIIRTSIAGAILMGGGLTSSLALGASSIYLDYANSVPTGSRIFLNRLPIRLPNGSYIYKDVTITLQADNLGVVSAPGPIAQALSPPVLSASFKAGIYVAPDNTIYGFALNGPAVVPGNVVTKWQAVVTPTKSRAPCGVPAVFYVGPLGRNPYYTTRLQPARITNIEYSYGIVAGNPACGGRFGTNAIVGFSQSGSVLTIASFTDSSGADHNVPVEILTYSAQ